MYILEYEILSIPEKLKAIRKYLGLKQEDLTNGIISRSLISYIENGKVELTKETASIICDSIKQVLDQKNISFEVDVEYLTSNEKKQAEILIERHLNKLREIKNVKEDTNFTELIKKIEKILTKWELPEKRLVTYELIGDMYYDKSEFDESYIYYIKALENSVESSKFESYVKILSKLGRCCIRMRKYLNAIKFNDDALAILEINNIEDDVLYMRCLFNNALAYEYLGFYDKSLSCLERLKKLDGTFSSEQFIDILIVEGKCYCKKGDLKVAERAYQEALREANRNNMPFYKSMALTNISALYQENDDIEMAIYYDKEALRIKEDINDERIGRTLLELGKKYITLKQYDLAEKYLLRGINEINLDKDLSTYIKINFELLNIYISTNEHYLISKIIKEIKNIYISNYEKYNNQDLKYIESFLLKSISYLLEKDIPQSKELLNLVLERRSEE